MELFGLLLFFGVVAVALWVMASSAFGNPFRVVRRHLLGTFLLEHIGVMARLGLPLAQGLSACKAQPSRGSRKDLRDVEDGLSKGLLVGDALGRVPCRRKGLWDKLEHACQVVQLELKPRLVTPAEAEVLRIGEMSGDLAGAVRLVLEERRRFAQLRNWLYTAFIYPVFVLCVAGSLLAGILIYIVPKFRAMFDEYDIDLPAMTQRLERFAAASAAAWYWLVPVLLGLIWVLRARAKWVRPLMRGCGRTREFLQRLLYLIPFSLGVMRRMLLAEFCTEVAMLLRVGTPAHRALHVVAEGTMNPWFCDRVRRAAELCEGGVDLASALDKANLDRRAAWFSRGARDAANLAESLHSLADDYRARVSWSVSVAIRLVPPIVILGIGVAVGYVVIALFLPLVKMVSTFEF